MGKLTLRTSIPEVHDNQWNYLYSLISDQLALDMAQQSRLAELFEVIR